MRTGAIFARGSCRALKWMALFGAVFTLGASYAAAQPTVAGTGAAEFVGAVITVSVTDTATPTAAHMVTGTPNASDFEIAGTAAQSATVSGSEITVTFASAATVTVGASLEYTQPGDTRKQITSVATGVALANFTTTLAEKDIPPVFSVSTGPDLEVRVNVAITTPLDLPMATGGNGAITYTVTPTLPAGLALVAATPAAGTAPMITGTATSMTSGPRTFQLAAGDADANAAIGDIANVNFTITVGDVPATPAAPTVTATGSMQASVTWVAPAINNSAILAYNLQYSTTGGPWINAGSNLPPSATTATVTFPAAGTYSVRVQAANSFGASQWSTGGSVTVSPAAPLVAPTLTTTAYMSRVGVAISSITLPATTGGFPPLTYSVSGQPAGLTFTPAATTGGGTLAGTPSAVTTGAQTVTYMVTDSDTPPAQQSATFTYTVTDVPGAPTGLTFTPTASSTTLDVSWTAPTVLNNLPLTGYDLQYMPMGGTAWTVMTVTSTSAVITVPVAGSYDVRVRATNADGSSAWLSGTGSSVASGVVLPPLPTTLSTGVMHRRGVAFTPVTLPAATGGLAPLTYSMSGLPAGMSFSPTTRELSGTPTAIAVAPANVVTYMATDASSPAMSASATFTFTVTDVPDAPAKPTVTATANTRGSLSVSWTAPADNGSAIEDYDVQYRVTGTTNWTIMTDVADTPATLTELSNATEYDVQVRATNGNGAGPWSVSGRGETVAGPSPPSTTLADITKIELSGAEERQIGGEKRLHLEEGDTSTVTVTVEWTVAQLREIYAADASPNPIYIDFDVERETDGASWLSGAEVYNQDGQDVPDNFEWARIDIPKKPKDSARGRATVTGTGTTRLALLQDDDAEDEGFRLVVGTGSDGVSLDASRSMLETEMLLVIDDDETQGITLKQTSKGDIYEGGADVEFEVRANPPLMDLVIDVGFDLTDEKGAAVSSRVVGLNPARDAIHGGDDKIEVAIALEDNDGNRKDEELTLHAEIASRNRDDIEDASMSFKVLDVHKLPPLTVSPEERMVDEGGEIELTLTLDRNPRDTIAIDPETRLYTSEPVDVMLMGMPKGIVQIMPSPAKFPKHDGKAPWTQEMKVKVSAPINNDLDGDRMVTVSAEVAGTIAANGMQKSEPKQVATLTVKDGTAKLVWAKPEEDVQKAVYDAIMAGAGDDGILTADEMVKLNGNDLFDAAEGVTVTYSGTSSDQAVVPDPSSTGNMITATATGMGMAKITVKAHASRPSGAMVNPQTDPREASITFQVDVGLVALTLELSGPEGMHLVEGGMTHANGTPGSAQIMVKANRPVTEAVTVNLKLDRTMSGPGITDDDFMAEPIVIAAGTDSGATMLTAKEDGMAEEMEELVLYGMAADNAGQVTGTVKLYLWDSAVPALPVIAQLLLAALMAVGGYRRYIGGGSVRRRRS